jgi:hypothetical protein
MKPKHILKVVLGVSLISLGSAVAADDVDSILKQISGESSGGGSSSGSKNTSLKKSSSSDSGTTSRKKSTQASAPSIKIWNPKDKLPSDVSGQGVAGNFAFYGTNTEGNPILIPAEDASNPFARQFWIVNMHDRVGPNVLIPASQRRLVQVSSRRPLVFVGRGILPGVYNVQLQ